MLTWLDVSIKSQPQSIHYAYTSGILKLQLKHCRHCTQQEVYSKTIYIQVMHHLLQETQWLHKTTKFCTGNLNINMLPFSTNYSFQTCHWGSLSYINSSKYNLYNTPCPKKEAKKTIELCEGHLYSTSPNLCHHISLSPSMCQKLSKLVEIAQSSDKNKFASFLGHGVLWRLYFDEFI